MPTNQLDAIVNQVNMLPPEALVQLIKRAAELLEQKQPATLPVDYLALIGSGKGAYSSSEEADQFLRRERDAWEK